MALNVPSNAGVLAVDTSTISKTINIPLSTDHIGRILTIKDKTGQADTNPIVLQLQGGDTFQNGATSYIINTSFGIITIVSRSGQWLFEQNSTQEIQILQSTIQGLGTIGYISSASLHDLVSTPNLINLVSTPNLLGLVSTTLLDTSFLSTIEGLGTAAYISSSQLISTVEGLGSSDYISTLSLVSTVQGIESQGYLTSNFLVSTVEGLGSSDYISSSQLISTVEGLGNIYISTAGGGLSIQDLTSTVEGLGSSDYISTLSLLSSIEGLGMTGYVSTLNGGMFTMVPATPANIQFLPPTNSIKKIANDNADDYMSTRELYPFNAVSFTTNFATLNFQTVNLIRGFNLYYGLLFHQNGFVYVQINGSATPSLGPYDSNDTYSIQLTPNNVYWYRNNQLAYAYDVAPVQSMYYLEINLRSLNDTVENLSYGGTTSPTQAASSILYFNTPLPLALNSVFLSTNTGLASLGYISSSQLISTVQGIESLGYLTSNSLISTVEGLGSSDYISSSQLISTVEGLGNIYLSTGGGGLTQENLNSTIEGLGTYAYVSSLIGVNEVSTFQMNASSINVGSAFLQDGFLLFQQDTSIFPSNLAAMIFQLSNTPNWFIAATNTQELYFTTSALDGSFIQKQVLTLTSSPAVGVNCNTPQYTLDVNGSFYASSIAGDGSSIFNLNAISSLSLLSTVEGLGNIYISTGGGGGITQENLNSTIEGLGTYAYISTGGGGSDFFTISTGSLGASSIVTESLFALSSISTYSLTVYGPSTLTVQGNFIMDGGSMAAPIASTIGATSNALFVAAGTGAGSLQYSYDGSNWNYGTGVFTNPGNTAHFNGSNLWVAVGQTLNSFPTFESIKYSADGISWTDQATGGFSNNAYGIWYDPTATLWVAAGNDSFAGAGNMKYSGDGSNWSNSVSGAFASQGFGVTSDGAGFWVAVGDDGGPNSIKYSGDGSNWSNPASGGFSVAGKGVAYNGTSLWVAVGSGGGSSNIRYSGDGSNWSDAGNFGAQGNGVAYNGTNLWVAVGQGVGGTSNIQYSGDGSNWSNCASGDFGQAGNGVAYSPELGLWVAAGDNLGANQLLYSGDGSNWSNPASLTGMPVGNGVGAGIIVSPSYLSYNRFNIQNAGKITASTIILADDSDTTPTTSNDTRLALYSGTAFQPVNATWNTLSDQRIKTNITLANLELCYSNIKELPLRYFGYEPSFVEKAKVKDKHVLGFIAQEVSTIFPKAITNTSGYGFDTIMSLNQDQIYMAMVGSVKKLMDDKEQLEQRVSTLEGYFTRLQ